jgi:nitric oxide dioxygenase
MHLNHTQALEYHQKANSFCSGFPNELDAETLQVIHTTAPVVVQHMSEITRTFYGIMLEKYPITKTLFNPAHFLPEEESGKTPQSVALGEAIVKGCSFLTNFNGFKGTPFLELTAQKHCALGVQAEHYPIVYECFMKAVKKVLGSAVTPEIGAAWSKVVLYQARGYIEREADIYTSVTSQGGWMGFKNFKIDDIKKETDAITSYTLSPVDETALPAFKPGSYVAIRMQDVGQSPSHIRTYSLSNSCNQKTFTITVKTEKAQQITVKDKLIDAPCGVFSNLMNERLKVGSIVELSSPFGNFLLKEDHNTTEPIVFLAGGIGITPVVSMLRTLTENGSKAPLYVLYAVRSSEYHAFHDAFKSISTQFPNVKYHVLYSEPKSNDVHGDHYHTKGKISAEVINTVVGSHALSATYYICGDPIIRPCTTLLKEMAIPAENINFEFFGPLGTHM